VEQLTGQFEIEFLARKFRYSAGYVMVLCNLQVAGVVVACCTVRKANAHMGCFSASRSQRTYAMLWLVLRFTWGSVQMRCFNAPPTTSFAIRLSSLEEWAKAQ
jgi:hypothetical protein